MLVVYSFVQKIKNLKERFGEMQRKHQKTSAKLEEEKNLKVDRLNAMKVSPAVIEGPSDTLKESQLLKCHFSAGLLNKTMAVCEWSCIQRVCYCCPYAFFAGVLHCHYREV